MDELDGLLEELNNLSSKKSKNNISSTIINKESSKENKLIINKNSTIKNTIPINTLNNSINNNIQNDENSLKNDSGYISILENYKKKKEELIKLKQKCVNEEDYDNALYYKEQIEKLDQNMQKDIENYKKIKQTKSTTIEPPLTIRKQTDSNKISLLKKQYPQDSKLYDAVRSGRSQEVIRVLNEENFNINSIDFNSGNTGLHAAAMIHSIPLIKFLVDNGADCTIRNRRGQTPLHISVERRVDEGTKYMIEMGNGDIYLKDNMGLTPLDISGKAPVYQEELKDIFTKTQEKRKKNESLDTLITVIESPSILEEIEVQVYLRNGNYHSFIINTSDTASKLISLMAEKLKITKLIDHLELTEDIMGKERRLKEDENINESLIQWPNNNPKYCKFVLKLKRGSPSDVQMIFREVMYGNIIK